jgi:hypothetical protein
MARLQRLMIAAMLCTSLLPGASAADASRFDLAGPKIDIRVTRKGVTLPIASVPNLQPGDQIWIHPDFPPSQSVHYLLIAAFLRGTTNPPPDEWFSRIETWQKKVREEGVVITVPAEAQQAILFLAPETGGDFSTLRSAVKGRPGIFVRASQDLAEAGFEQARLEKYLADIKHVPAGDADALKQHSDLLARTLALKPNAECFKKPEDQQYNCLTQTGSQLLLDDGHGQTLSAALSNGPASDFINQASYTNLAGGGNYSAYVGAIVDLVRLTSTLHTAQYQYIPAISYPDPDAKTGPSETLNLRLNTAPSFHNPKSVIVIGLPAVAPSVLPPLRPADPNHVSCLLDPHMALPIEGAPLVFSTDFAHDLVLHLNVPPSATQKQNLPLRADAYQGGLTIDTHPVKRRELSPDDPNPISEFKQPDEKPTAVAKGAPPAAPGEPVTGTIEGFWGFDHYTGPTLPVQLVPGQGWRIVTSAQTPAVLIAGQPNHLQLAATGTACVQSISLEPGDDKVEWKLTPAPEPPKTPVASEVPPPPPPARTLVRPVEVTLNLQHAATPGSIRLAIQQFGEKDPDQLGTKSFAEPAKINAFNLHAGDLTAQLSGNSLDQVKDLTFSVNGKDYTLTPGTDTDAAANTALTLALPADSKPPNLKPNDKITAEVHLKDGRTLSTSTLVLPSRPSVTILSRKVVQPSPSPIQLASAEDLPLGAQLTFFLKSKEKFPRNEQIEIMSKDTPDASGQSDPPLKTTLSIAAGTLVLEDNHTVLATFDPLKTFGPSTFGQFRLRAVGADGTAGEWLPLATIVRLPNLTDLHCPVSTGQSCQLAGSSLYLIDAVATDQAFTAPVDVPEGYVEPILNIPHPNPDGKPTAKAPAIPATFYIRLRDDPTVADSVTLPLLPEPGAVTAPRPKTVAVPPSITPAVAPEASPAAPPSK